MCYESQFLLHLVVLPLHCVFSLDDWSAHGHRHNKLTQNKLGLKSRHWETIVCGSYVCSPLFLWHDITWALRGDHAARTRKRERYKKETLDEQFSKQNKKMTSVVSSDEHERREKSELRPRHTPWCSCSMCPCIAVGITGSGSSCRKSRSKLTADAKSASFSSSTSSPLS